MNFEARQNNHIIHAEQLSWKPDDKTVLNRVNCNFLRGQITAVIGANGAGKSSLFAALQGHIKLHAGDIIIDNQSLSSYSRTQLARKIATVPQSTALLFDLTVMDVVRMALLPWKGPFSIDSPNDKQWLEQCMEQTGCVEFKQRKYNSLSGGEQQRVLLARALAQKTDIVLLDEPTSHLDVHYQHEIMMLLQQLNKTIVLTIHDLNLASQYCAAIWIMKQGKMLAGGTPHSVLKPEILEAAFDLPCSVSLPVGAEKPIVCFHPGKATSE